MKKIEFNENKNIISKRLRYFRKELGLIQTELAARMQTYDINIDQQMISRIENNRRIVTDYELACLCQVLRINENDMLRDFHLQFPNEP